MVSRISKTIIDQLLDLDIEYRLDNGELPHLLPLFKHFEKTRKQADQKAGIKITEEPVSIDSVVSKLSYSKYTDKEVSTEISKFDKTGLLIEVFYNDKITKLYIFGYTNQDIEKYKDKLLETFIFATQLTHSSVILNSVIVYLTNLEKKVDNIEKKQRLLTTKEVNTGVSFAVGNEKDIILWRKEEVVKVMLHELIHAFDWDFNDNNKIFSYFSKKLGITKKVLLNEAYTEIWACITNCYICSLSESSSEERFCRWIHYLELETLYSVWQTYKIIYMTNLHLSNSQKVTNCDNFLQLTDKSTNVFPYYLLKSCVLFNISEWVCFCKKNTDFIKYKHSDTNDKKIAGFFLDSLSSDNYYSLCNKIKNAFEKNYKTKKIYKTMRMTALELV